MQPGLGPKKKNRMSNLKQKKFRTFWNKENERFFQPWLDLVLKDSLCSAAKMSPKQEEEDKPKGNLAENIGGGPANGPGSYPNQ